MPFYRDAQPPVKHSPPPGTDQQIGSVLVEQRPVDGGDVLGDGHCVGGVEGVGPDEDDVGHGLFAAMAQGLSGVAQGIGCILIRHFHVMQILSGGHGPHLEDSEVPS